MALLAVRDVALRLGVSYSTLKQWIYKGSVRTSRTEGGHHRVSDTELNRLLMRQNKVTSPKRLGTNSGIFVSLSGRNRLRGIVDEVRWEGLLAQVRLRVGDQILNSVITKDAADELQLKRGDEATAIIKSTEVMIARETTESQLDQHRHRTKREKIRSTRHDQRMR